MAQFPSLKAKKMLAILMRSPLHYQVFSCAGAHRKLRSSQGYPDIGFSYHDSKTIPARAVKKILVQDIGLSVQEALNLL